MSSFRYLILAVCCGCLMKSGFAQTGPALESFADVNRYVQERSAKIYGAGGMRQLEAYQSGMLVSADGHVATVASVVLDQDVATVILGDGRRFQGEVVGVDPLMDIAVLKLDSDEDTFPHFDVGGSPYLYEGMRVLAFSNLYNVATGDEPVSVLHGTLSAIAPLEARRGAFSTRYRGDVYIVDAATNNPGAAGGILVDTSGQLLGMLGKEVRSEVTGAWLNYALPMDKVAQSVVGILSGDGRSVATTTDDSPEQPATFHALGFHLVPSVVPRTPPYVDDVRPNSPAAAAGVRADDLVITIGGMRTGTRSDVERALAHIPLNTIVELTLLRGRSLVEVELTPVTTGTP